MSAVFERLNRSLADSATSGRLKVSQERRCRVCHARGRQTRHHLVPQAWFFRRRQELRVLRNANANIVPLCENCHRIIDGVRDPVGRLQKRAALRAALYSNEVSFILQIRGRRWLEDHYPRHP